MATLPAAEPLAPAGLLAPAPARVLAVRQETSDTWTLDLAPPAGYSFAPGQFDMLYAFGVGEAPISHSGDPALAGERLVHTIRAVGPVTRALCAARPGEVVGLRGPFGSAWPLAQARGGDLVIVAGGIGLAPLRPLVLAALAARAEFGRVALLVGARTPRDLLYPQELEAWRARGLEVLVTVDAAAGDWSGRVGVVTRLIPEAGFDPARALAVVCGPEVMMRFTAQGLLGRGVAPERVFLSMERNMKCAVALCGHCQLGPGFVCREGPVYAYPRLAPLLAVREL